MEPTIVRISSVANCSDCSTSKMGRLWMAMTKSTGSTAPAVANAMV